MTDLTGQYLGRYYLTERLGEGGMATVYKGYDTRLERDVAVKIIRSAAFPAEKLEAILKRFEREAKSLAKLSHPNIVKVYDYGEHEGSPYLVMEYMPGGTLKKRIGAPMPWRDAIGLLLPIGRSVAYAHQRGILHRDIKPANILISEAGEPMLSDFGIAKLFEGEQSTTLTGSGMPIGTPEYMAPEQWTGMTSPQSDLYSLGMVLYEMVTGRKPYAGDTPAAILIKQATEPLPSPRKFVPELPKALERILGKALAKEAKDRYQDVNVFISTLENINGSAATLQSPAGLKPVGEAFKVPSKRTHEERKNLHAPGGGESKTVDDLPSPRTVAKPFRRSLKFSPRVTGALIGGIILVFALWLSSSLIAKRFVPIPAFTQTVNFVPPVTSQSLTVSPSEESIQASETLITAPAETSDPKSASLPNEITDAKGVSMLLVPAGEFTMGGDNGAPYEKPVHQVYLDAFYIDKYEVTNAHYKSCVDAGACSRPHFTNSVTHSTYYGDSKFDQYPVIQVDWYQAKKYCSWRNGSLPTEAQWEKAARGTDERTYPWGEGIDCSKANYNSCVGDTSKVGKYEIGKSSYNVYDLAGNVWEWTADWYSKDYYQESPSTNPAGPSSGQYRVMRGGGWSNAESNLRTSSRNWYDPIFKSDYVGFRCALSSESTTLQSVVTQTLTLADVVGTWQYSRTSCTGGNVYGSGRLVFRRDGTVTLSDEASTWKLENNSVVFRIQELTHKGSVRGNVMSGIISDFYCWSAQAIVQPEVTSPVTAVPTGSSFQYTPGPAVSVLNVMPEFSLPYQFNAHQKTVTRVAFSADGALFATGSADASVKLWRVTDGKLVKTLAGHTYNISGVAFLPDGVLLVTSSLDDTIKLWNIATGNLITTLKNPGKGSTLDGITEIAVPGDGSFLLSDSYTGIRVWDLSQLHGTRNLCDRSGNCPASESLAVSPDGKWVAIDIFDLATSKTSVQIYSVADSQVTQTLSLNNSGVGSLRYSPDGHFLAAGEANNSVVVWDTSNWRVLHTFAGHRKIVTSVAFSPNNLVLASASRDQTVKLWRVSDGALLASLKATSPVNTIAFSPNGSLLLAGFEDGTAALWDVSAIK